MKVIVVKTIECEKSEVKEVMDYLYYQELFNHKMIKWNYLNDDSGIIETDGEQIKISIAK